MDDDKNKIAKLQNQLTIARNEINKLRQQMRNLQYMQQKDIEGLAHVLREFRCEGCRQATEENNRNSNNEARGTSLVQLQDSSTDAGVKLPIIGLIRTLFPEKRAVPRQSSIGSKLRAVIELNSDAFTNPEHALEGLSDYSHMWVIYHFHKNSSHPKAKVAPPRLDGERVGVFSTRSPHRPCPIGLSLVEIDKIENATVAFYGTDMVDGTPVLDIKPYIPFYDAPISSDSDRASAGLNETVDFYNSRQEPDGEESELEMLGAAGIGVGGYTNNISALPPSSAVKVPNWVVASHRLSVCFNERAISQLQELQVQTECITDILEADPRSVYLRTKHGSQIFTFQLSEVTVTCKFDDKAGTVTVVQVRRTENVQDNDDVSEQC